MAPGPIDIGTDIPHGIDDTHAITRQLAPESSAVHVDNDPMVLANAHTLRHTPHHGGATEFVQGDLREPGLLACRSQSHRPRR